MDLMKKIMKSFIEGMFLRKCKLKILKLFDVGIKNLDEGIGILARKIFYFVPKVKQNKVVFMTYKNDYTCNPKYIAEEIIRQGLDYDLVWAVDNNSLKKQEQFPETIRLVKRGSFEFFYEIASAKIWVDNALNFIWKPCPKKKEQVYLQTWHGSLGIKRIGEADIKNKRWLWSAKYCNQLTNYCISNSRFESNEVYRTTYWEKTPILLYGHARNDILINASPKMVDEIKEKVVQFFGLDKSDKIVLYAPTFRDGKNIDCYNLDYDKLIETLENKFGGNWKVLLRFHFKNAKKGNNLNMSEHIYNATAYLDIQELMLAADIGITDYSSWIYDFILTRKPGFIFASDRNLYEKERGFYYSLDETPFPVAEDNQELMEKIISFDMQNYIENVEKFLQDKGCIDDGHASERIVEKIKDIINK